MCLGWKKFKVIPVVTFGDLVGQLFLFDDRPKRFWDSPTDHDLGGSFGGDAPKGQNPFGKKTLKKIYSWGLRPDRSSEGGHFEGMRVTSKK